MSKPGPSPKVTPEDVLGIFAEREDTDEPLTAPEIAAALGCSRKTARKRLQELDERGDVASKKVGARAVVWWLTTERTDESSAPAAPLHALVGMLDEDEAEAARSRSREWREEFDREMDVSGS